MNHLIKLLAMMSCARRRTPASLTAPAPLTVDPTRPIVVRDDDFVIRKDKIDLSSDVSCEYHIRPLVKKELHEMSSQYNEISKRNTTNTYSGAVTADDEIPLLGAVAKTKRSLNWTNTFTTNTEHTSGSTQTKKDEVENFQANILVREVTYTQSVNGRAKPSIVVPFAVCPIPEANLQEEGKQLKAYAQEYMEETYPKEDTSNAKVHLEGQVVKDIYIRWESCAQGDPVPHNAVSTGVHGRDGDAYVARLDNTPGKASTTVCPMTKERKISHFYVNDYIYGQHRGQVLVTNAKYAWQKIQRGESIPERAVCAGRDKEGHNVWIGRSVGGEPGKITCTKTRDDPAKPYPATMSYYFGHYTGKFKTEAEVLVIKGPDDILFS